MDDLNVLINGLDEFNLELDQGQIEKFKIYKDLLIEWNKKINITSIEDEKEIDIKHFLDSISVVKTGLIKDGNKIIDIGTGGGFPGLPIKIVNDTVEVVLLDSLNKRIKFLNEVINTLKLKKATTIHGRAEDFGKNEKYREQFDIAVSRAVASLNILCEYSLPFVKVGGYFIAMKGKDVEEEIKESKKAINLLGGKLDKKLDMKLPQSDIVHSLVIIEKIKHTPTKYPRNPGKPKKNPL